MSKRNKSKNAKIQANPSVKDDCKQKQMKREGFPAVPIVGMCLLMVLTMSGIVWNLSSLLDWGQPQVSSEPAMPAGQISEVPSEMDSSDLSSPVEQTAHSGQVDVQENSKNREEALLQSADEIMSQMTLEEKVYQMFIVAPDGLNDKFITKADGLVREALEQTPVGGIVLFRNNIKNPEQCRMLINNVQSYSKIGLFIVVDEEGGDMAGIENNPEMRTTSFPPMSEIGASGDPMKAYEVGLTIGRESRELGFNLDFAPVCDIVSDSDSFIGNRSFGSDPELVAKMVENCVGGFRAAGMLCSLKYFPGHGDTTQDSHNMTVTIEKTMEELEQRELIPFRRGIAAGADLVMVGHITNPIFTEEEGEGTSSGVFSTTIVTKLLRQRLGFNGLIITDVMNISAVSGVSQASVGVRAVQAGVDIILAPASLQKTAQGILDAVESGEITEERINESVRRILVLKLKNGIASPVGAVTE